MEQTGRDPREYKYLVGHSDVTVLSFHPIQTNTLAKTKYEKIEAHNSDILDVCYSPNDDFIASVSEDNIRVQVSEDRHFTKFEGHRSNVRSVQFSPKGTRDNFCLVSASDDKNIILWIPLMGNFKIFTRHTHLQDISSVNCVKFSFDGTSGRCVKTFNDIKNLKILFYIVPTRYVELYPTGTIIGSANEDGCIKLYDLVNMVKFYLNENFILTASDDSTMKMILDLLKSRSIYYLSNKLKKLHLESDNNTRLSAKIIESKVNVKNIKPFQIDCVQNRFTVISQQFQTVLHNQTSSNVFSSNRIKTIENKILDKIQLLHYHYNV
ncbi:POC1 centriolar protein like protein B [Atta colombica]|uniref:POC1 centriolar protein like protein B n=1 Tax=Atta colombica TaxID=520822 RepID=A0A195BFU1_9HYME|nr:POC1 centriolar protein like protein B [Atta colombica]